MLYPTELRAPTKLDGNPVYQSSAASRASASCVGPLSVDRDVWSRTLHSVESRKRQVEIVVAIVDERAARRVVRGKHALDLISIAQHREPAVGNLAVHQRTLLHQDQIRRRFEIVRREEASRLRLKSDRAITRRAGRICRRRHLYLTRDGAGLRHR